MSVTQSDRAARFKALHQGPGAFLIPNVWDAGSARLLAGLGFQALATSSGACAAILGRRDGEVTRDEALAHARAIVEATDLPVSADLERGFGDAPAVMAETFNFMAGITGKSFSVAELERAGVRRISLASSLYRAAMSGLLDAAREVKEKGTFAYLDRSVTTPELYGLMRI